MCWSFRGQTGKLPKDISGGLETHPSRLILDNGPGGGAVRKRLVPSSDFLGAGVSATSPASLRGDIPASSADQLLVFLSLRFPSTCPHCSKPASSGLWRMVWVSQTLRAKRQSMESTSHTPLCRSPVWGAKMFG